MTVDAHYFSPTTPGAASFDVDVSDFIRRGRIGPLSKEAQLGAVGSGVVVLDDLDGTLGQASDGILGLKQFYMNETECPAGDRRFFTGYTFDRRYYRGDSLVHGPARKVDVTLMDPNAFLSFRVFAPVEIDPTSSFVRPLEDSIDRIQALLAVDFLSTTLFDLGYIPTTGGVEMSANDYTGQKPADVINDIAQVSGWNAWVGYDETENKLFLWFDDWETDGSSTIPYDSTIKLTNVESEANGTDTFLFELNAVETVSPGRVVSAAYGTGTGVTGYRILAQTANTFGWRDMVAPSVFVKEQDKLDALLDRYLLDNSTEEVRISLTVQIPVDKVTAIKEGQRIQVHGTHMKSVADDFTWTRILHESIRRDIATMEFYWLDLEVSPMLPMVVSSGILYRAASPDCVGTAVQIGWQCSGDADIDGVGCNSGSWPVAHTVGPMYPTIGSIPGVGTSYVGWTFEGSGTIDFESAYQFYTAVGGITCTVQIKLNGVVVASGSVASSGSGGTITIDDTITVEDGDVLTAWFSHNGGGSPIIYVDFHNFTITGGALA